MEGTSGKSQGPADVLLKVVFVAFFDFVLMAAVGAHEGGGRPLVEPKFDHLDLEARGLGVGGFKSGGRGNFHLGRGGLGALAVLSAIDLKLVGFVHFVRAECRWTINEAQTVRRVCERKNTEEDALAIENRILAEAGKVIYTPTCGVLVASGRDSRLSFPQKISSEVFNQVLLNSSAI